MNTLPSGSAGVAPTWVLVGEQPGDKEDLAAKPFVGPAGKLLMQALDEVGLPAADLYFTNAVKHFGYELRGKRRLHKTPAQRDIEACRGWLVQELTVVKPKLVIALGATALKALLHRPVPVLNPRREFSLGQREKRDADHVDREAEQHLHDGRDDEHAGRRLHHRLRDLPEADGHHAVAPAVAPFVGAPRKPSMS